MPRSFFVAPLLLIAMICGCQPITQGPALSPSHPVSPQELASIRASYHQRIPESRVGMVKDVDVTNSLASVGDVNVADFQIDDIITFLDSNGAQLSDGSVEGSANNLLIVKFKVLPGGRAPTEGDVAVRVVK